MQKQWVLELQEGPETWSSGVEGQHESRQAHAMAKEADKTQSA